MKHKYQVEVMEKMGNQLVPLYATQSFVCNYADARAVLHTAADLAAKAVVTQMPFVQSITLIPAGNDSFTITWDYPGGFTVTREVDLVRIGDAP